MHTIGWSDLEKSYMFVCFFASNLFIQGSNDLSVEIEGEKGSSLLLREILHRAHLTRWTLCRIEVNHSQSRLLQFSTILIEAGDFRDCHRVERFSKCSCYGKRTTMTRRPDRGKARNGNRQDERFDALASLSAGRCCPLARCRHCEIIPFGPAANSTVKSNSSGNFVAPLFVAVARIDS